MRLGHEEVKEGKCDEPRPLQRGTCPGAHLRPWTAREMVPASLPLRAVAREVCAHHQSALPGWVEADTNIGEDSAVEVFPFSSSRLTYPPATVTAQYSKIRGHETDIVRPVADTRCLPGQHLGREREKRGMWPAAVLYLGPVVRDPQSAPMGMALEDLGETARVTHVVMVNASTCAKFCIGPYGQMLLARKDVDRRLGTPSGALLLLVPPGNQASFSC